MENQLLIEGALADRCNEIITKRAQARQQHGWIMDVYLLRKRNIRG